MKTPYPTLDEVTHTPGMTAAERDEVLARLEPKQHGSRGGMLLSSEECEPGGGRRPRKARRPKTALRTTSVRSRAASKPARRRQARV